MKTIELRDEDYKALMELSKELQTQDNHGQRFPYYWNPSSIKRVPDEDGEFHMIYDYDLCESYTIEEYAERDNDLWNEFCAEWFDEDERDWSDIADILAMYSGEWVEHIQDKRPNTHIYHETEERKCEHNISFFLSDVKSFIKCNSHHLDRDPKTYGRSVWRMGKMEKLMEILLRINNDVPEEEINHEALRVKKSCD